jgi:hypothetical protein
MKLYALRSPLAMLLLTASCGPAGESELETLGTAITIDTAATYGIVGVGSGKCVQIQGGSTADLARAQIASCNGSSAQAFRIESAGGGFYSIRNLGSGKCLDVQGRSTADGAAVVQYTCNGGTNQQWSFIDVSTGVVRAVARHSNKVLDVQGAATADGSNLLQWTWSGGSNQQFRMNATGGSTGGGSTATGAMLGGVCYRICASAASDPDGDGWGWENSASCVVRGSAPHQQSTACSAGGQTGGTGGTSGGGTGGGTAGGSSGSTSCNVAPINPNATTQARKLLCYIYSQYGNHVLSGQQETSWASNPADDVNWINSNTGRYPAILGGDYLYPNGTTTRAIAYWNAGGIPMIRYHMGAPPQADTYQSSMGTANLGNVLTSGTAENRSLFQKMDYAAAELQKLQAANVAVLWAPFHEAQPNGWFWWSKGSGAQFVQLWRTMYDYFTTTKRLNNLVWLMPFSGSPNSAFYPGKQYADLAGPDTYSTGQPFTSMFNATRNIVGTTIPIPLHETGTVPDPNAMFNNNAAPWVLFNIWAGYQRSNNSLTSIRNTYSNSRTVTRDEVPNLN